MQRGNEFFECCRTINLILIQLFVLLVALGRSNIDQCLKYSVWVFPPSFSGLMSEKYCIGKERTFIFNKYGCSSSTTKNPSNKITAHLSVYRSKNGLICLKCRKVLNENFVAKAKFEPPRLRLFLCYSCFRLYSCFADFSKHLGKHKGKFPCRYCEKTLNKNQKLRTHLMQHCARPFTCSHCFRS